MPSKTEHSLTSPGARCFCVAVLVVLGACDATTATGGGGAGGHPTGTGGGGGHSSGTGGAGGSSPATCTFSTTYTVTEGGGLAALQKQTLLSPPALFHYERQNFVTDAGTTSCMPALPACGAPAQVDVSDIESAMASADVQAAFAASPPPNYGATDVADGPFFGVERATGGSFSVGIECTDASATCLPTPPGVHALVQLLHEVITQQLADPSCASVQN